MSEPEPPGAEATGPTGEVGSVGDEAAKLLGAISEWAMDHRTDLGQGIGGFANQAGLSMRELNDHLATGGPECLYCPLCRTVHAVRQTSPEVRTHLATAAASLMQAAAGLLATHVASDATVRRKDVEHIDLDTDGEPWPE